MVTVDPSKPRRSGESRLSAISAPLPVRGGGHGDGRALERPADQRRIPARAPLSQQDAVPLRQPPQEAAPEQRRVSVEVGLRTAPAAVPSQMPQAGRGHLEPEHGEQHDGGYPAPPAAPGSPRPAGRATPSPPRTTARGSSGRTTPIQKDASASARPPPYRPKRSQRAASLAVRGHVGQERRPHGQAETGGGPCLRPVSVDKPPRPAPLRPPAGGRRGPVGSDSCTLSTLQGCPDGHRQPPVPPRLARAPTPDRAQPRHARHRGPAGSSRPRPRPRRRARRSSRGRRRGSRSISLKGGVHQPVGDDDVEREHGEEADRSEPAGSARVAHLRQPYLVETARCRRGRRNSRG